MPLNFQQLRQQTEQERARITAMDPYDRLMATGRRGMLRDSGPDAGWQEIDMGSNQLYLLNPTTREVKKAPVMVQGFNDSIGGNGEEWQDVWGQAPSKDNFLDKYGLALVGGGLGLGALSGLSGGAGAAGGLSEAAMADMLGLGSAADVAAMDSALGLGGAVSGGAAASGGMDMWDWLDDVGGGFDPGGEGTYGIGGGGPSMPPPVPEVDPTFGGILKEGLPGEFGIPEIPPQLKSLLEKLGPSALKYLTGSKGGVLDSITGDPLGAAFNSAPFLLALSEANRQGGDLDGVINKINGEGYTRAVLNPYDMDTGLGRTSLLNDMSLRGVSGSSFGNQSLNNYDYMRALGRGDLASKAQLSAANLEGSLINQRNTNRNMLLGAGLNASAKLFSPQTDPFNLQALRGLMP